jgi:hypothetical protein
MVTGARAGKRLVRELVDDVVVDLRAAVDAAQPVGVLPPTVRACELHVRETERGRHSTISVCQRIGRPRSRSR